MKKKILISLGVLVLLGGALVIGTFVYGFRVMTLLASSMSNTILPGEKVAMTKFYGDLKRGDLIVFKYPVNPSILYLKRVIGLPGETIEIRGKKVLINQQELPEKRVKIEIPVDANEPGKLMKELAEEGQGEYRVFYETETWDGTGNYDQGTQFATKAPYRIPAGQYFVLGDCRDNSQDSRYWGTVAQEAIVGKAYLIVSSPISERTFTELK